MAKRTSPKRRRSRSCSPERVDLYSCEMVPSAKTLYYVFTAPHNLVQVQTPAFEPGDSVCRGFLNSLYPDDIGWYDRAKLADTLPVYVFRLAGHTAVVANANRPGAVWQATANKLSDCDMRSLQLSLADNLTSRVLVLCQRRATLGSEREEVELEIEAVRQLVEKYLPNPVLEFLSPGTFDDDGVKPEGNADFNFNLTTDPKHADFETSRKFIAEHMGTYAMVVYHTCPFQALFSLPAVASLLQPGGTVIQTNEFKGVARVLNPKTFAERIAQVNGQRFGGKNNWRELVREFSVSPAQLVKKASSAEDYSTPGGP